MKEVKLIGKNIIHFIAENQYELCSSFIRIQEFYESPFVNINGKYFTLDDYMDVYAANNNNEFSYFTDWSGFNIPGNIVNKFFKLFNDETRVKEDKIKQYLISANISLENANYYVIGTFKDCTIEHEVAHALYYLNSEYKDDCNEIYKLLKPSEIVTINDCLKNYGYAENVFEDETQAYFSTDVFHRFAIKNTKRLNKIVQKYKDNFLQFSKNLYLLDKFIKIEYDPKTIEMLSKIHNSEQFTLESVYENIKNSGNCSSMAE